MTTPKDIAPLPSLDGGESVDDITSINERFSAGPNHEQGTGISISEMQERMKPWKNGIPAKRYYRLGNAAEIATGNVTGKIFSTEELLDLAVNKQIEVFIFAPDGFEFLHVAKFWPNGIGNLCLSPECLILFEQTTCKQIFANEVARSSDFKSAFRYNYGKPFWLNTKVTNPNFRGEIYVWRAFKQGAVHEIELTMSNLFVDHDELVRFVDFQNMVVSSSDSGNVFKNKAPKQFIEATNKLLDEIKKRMSNEGECFDKNKMLGTRNQFFYLLCKHSEDGDFEELKLTTVHRYLKGICKFARGCPARNAVDPYKKLFPEYYQ